LVVPTGRTDRDTFEQTRDACKAAGGWYSRKWGKTPGGFAFDTEADARAFAAALGNETEPETPEETATETATEETPRPNYRRDVLADDLRHHVFHVLDNEPEFTGDECDRIAQLVADVFAREYTA